MLSPRDILSRLRIDLGIDPSESSESSLLRDTRSANLCSGLFKTRQRLYQVSEKLKNKFKTNMISMTFLYYIAF